MKRGYYFIIPFFLLFLIIGCAQPQNRRNTNEVYDDERVRQGFLSDLYNIEYQEQDCTETRVPNCYSSIQGAIKIGDKDGFLKYHCNNIYFIEFPDPINGIAGETTFAQNKNGDIYELFGEEIEVKPDSDCTLIVKTDKRATGADSEFKSLVPDKKSDLNIKKRELLY